MTMTINQQFVDLAESAWMDGETQEYFNRFSPDHMDIDEFMDELDKRPEDELLANVFKAFGRDMYAEMHADGAYGVKDFIVWLYYLPDLPFIMMAWDMAADGWLDGGSDSIGRMEDYDEMDDVSEPNSDSMVGMEYDDPEGRWLIVGQAHDVVNIRCIGNSNCHPEGFQSCVPIEEARHYLTHDWTNW